MPGAEVIEVLRVPFARPSSVALPEGTTEPRIALGRRLFDEPALSRSWTLACSSCHIEALGYADGKPLAVGEAGTPLARHTPTLWNVGIGETFFWDGRAATLEEQARGPIEHPAEMALPLAEGVSRLAAMPSYRRAFEAAFPEAPAPSEDKVLLALASFERTLISPITRFDRWVGGEQTALEPAEIRGFLLFVGRAGCAECHSGWAFTDQSFHDIGLSGSDPGRGAILGLTAADHAFKTPTLREVGRGAPYMHDGRFATLEAVIDHYERGIVDRATVSADLRRIRLATAERADLLAFLATLTSEEVPRPLPRTIPKIEVSTRSPTATSPLVRQRNKRFAPGRLALAAGDTVDIVNDDTRLHNVRIHDPAMMLDSGPQPPGETVSIRWPSPGRYTVFCGIHPTMKLQVEVTAD